MRQTCGVDKFRNIAWTTRTKLERGLMLAFILCLTVVLMDAVSILAALPWDWGSAADWFTGGVTFAGFVGAIVALRVQTKGVGLQIDQHKTAQGKEEEKERQLQDENETRATEEKSRCARATRLEITALRGNPMPGHKPEYKPPLTVKCVVRAPKSFDLSNVQLTTPTLPPGFKVQEPSDFRADNLTHTRNLRWVMKGDYWSEENGKEEDAKAWVEIHTAVVFTDPAGFTWYLRGTGELTELN